MQIQNDLNSEAFYPKEISRADVKPIVDLFVLLWEWSVDDEQKNEKVSKK